MHRFEMPCGGRPNYFMVQIAQRVGELEEKGEGQDRGREKGERAAALRDAAVCIASVAIEGALQFHPRSRKAAGAGGSLSPRLE